MDRLTRLGTRIESEAVDRLLAEAFRAHAPVTTTLIDAGRVIDLDGLEVCTYQADAASDLFDVESVPLPFVHSTLRCGPGERDPAANPLLPFAVRRVAEKVEQLVLAELTRANLPDRAEAFRAGGWQDQFARNNFRVVRGLAPGLYRRPGTEHEYSVCCILTPLSRPVYESVPV